MRFRSCLPIGVLTICTALPAQAGAAPAPAKENRKFDIMLGAWEGKGTSTQTPGADPVAWTSRRSIRRVLGGHFVREDFVLAFRGGDEERPVAYRGYHGWDRARRRYLSVSMVNGGGVAATELHWIDDKTLMNSNTTRLHGKSIHQRWITKYIAEDRYKMLGFKSVDGGKEFVHVRAEFKKISGAQKPLAITTKKALMPNVKPLALRGMAGTYRVEGTTLSGRGGGEGAGSFDPDRAVALWRLRALHQRGRRRAERQVLRGHQHDGLGPRESLLQDGLG